jgi:hypothetical protein
MNEVSKRVLSSIDDVLVDVLGDVSNLQTTILGAKRLCSNDDELKEFLKDNCATRHVEQLRDSREKIQMLLNLISE